MIAAILSLALAAGTPTAPDCGFTHPTLCRNTNILAWEPDFDKKIKAFVGPGRARWLYKGRLADQVHDVFGGPPDPPARLGPYYLFTACRHHYCPEKGAMVIDEHGEIFVIGVVHYECGPNAPYQCAHKAILTILARNPEEATGVTAAIAEWVRKELPTGIHLDKVEIVQAEGVRPRRR